MNKKGRAVQRLRELGLNDLESQVYAFLLQHPPMTAYRVGKLLGRATANVYKAIESLARRGAVLVEDGDTRFCRAVPVEEFFDHLKSSFLRSTREAADALSELERPVFDERVYRLESVPALFDRARNMLASAETIVIIDAFPRSLEALKEDIGAAARRGIRVLVKAYAPFDVDGVDVVLGSDPKATFSAWRGEQVNLVVDGRELLVALLDAELTRADQAIWSRSLYMACSLHAGLAAERTLVKLRILAEKDPTLDQLKALVRGHQFLRDGGVPGYKELVARLANRSGDLP